MIIPQRTATPLLLLAIASLGHAADIDYAHPERYLAQGVQTTIAACHLPVIASIGVRTNTVAEIGKIVTWKGRFENVPAGGKFVGVRTVNDILASHQLTGCHDHGILLASLLRHFGFPAIMVDATGIAWSLLPPSERKGFIGHVFVETHAGGRWLLLNSTTGHPIPDYDPQDPVIRTTNEQESKGYHVMFKGVDPAGYGIGGIKELNDAQRRFAEHLKKTTPPLR